ncbi:hypothetical protein [Streptomyces sp. NPDC046859]|uniref:hypothetical protein n=1 Tax=Streptomyces sp. NPDC046859 TaxID=3155734 RepID=UPI0033F696CE
MNRVRREAAARRIMEAAPPPRVPPELYPEIVRRGERLLWRHRVAVRLMWLVLCAAAVAFTVWALTAQPWVEPPSQTTPPLTGW